MRITKKPDISANCLDGNGTVNSNKRFYAPLNNEKGVKDHPICGLDENKLPV